MALTSRHPLYKVFLPDWETMRDTYAGERAVKERGQRYLSPTSGMIKKGMEPNRDGWHAYNAYRGRSIFHDYVRDAVKYYVGLLHASPPEIELPAAMEPMRLNATLQHESLEQLMRRINEQQLVAGRYGIMLDIPEKPEPGHEMPYIATYNAETILNWDIGTRSQIDLPELNLVILDESTFKRVGSNFEWEWFQQYRVLSLGPVDTDENSGIYTQALFAGQEALFDPTKLEAPGIRGKTLEHIPFEFINTTDTLQNPDLCPLMGLARLALAIYRGEADYRQNLFMQGQDTLVVIGGKEDDNYQLGAGAAINLRAGAGVDAKFIGVTATGLSEQREALENDKMAARNMAGQLIDTRSAQKESGDALATRVSAQTATLNTMADTGACALEKLLKAAAVWMGADESKVKVTPNKEFADEPFTPHDLVDMMTGKSLGGPISQESIHGWLFKRGVTEYTYEEELDKIAEEAPVMGTGTTAGGDPVLDPKAGKPMLDPKTGKPTTQPGGTAEHPDVVNARNEAAAKATASGKPPIGGKKPPAKK